QKEIVRIESFWIDTWIKAHYKGVDRVYIIHDAVAHEVDEHTFYHTRESGGTKISSAYEMANRIIDTRYRPSDWNPYAFHFSDGRPRAFEGIHARRLLQHESARTPPRPEGRDRGVRPRVRARLLRDHLRGHRRRRPQRDRRLRRVPDPVPALVVRHAVRGAQQ